MSDDLPIGQPERQRDFRRVRLALMVAALAISFVAGSLGVLQVIQQRREIGDRAATEARNIALVIERDIAQLMHSYDLSIQAAINAYTLPGIDRVDPAIRQSALFDGAAAANWLGSIAILDSTGMVVEYTNPAMRGASLADRDFFTVHQQRLMPGQAYVGLPYVSRLRAGDPTFSLSREFLDAQGNFAGVVVGAIRLQYFADIFARLQLPEATRISLVRSDGALIARYPREAGDSVASVADAAEFAPMRASEQGQIAAVSSRNGASRFYTFRHVEGYPLILVVASNARAMAERAWLRAFIPAAGLGVLCLGAIVLALLFNREMLRRQQLELELAREATTDFLTGLGNKRVFNLTVATEWRRAARTAQPIALLMIDVDWFKEYNDAMGHQAGDAALEAVGSCIAESIRRPGDSGFRYGGEEFAVVLPNTGQAGAEFIAEKIRAALEQRGLPHPKSPRGRLTVSVGCAAATPEPGASFDMLLRAADRAVYAAKHRGKNQVAFSAPPCVPA